MKKTAIAGAFLLLALSLNINAAHAASCALGDSFSSETGLPCQAHAPCSPGDLFSSATGLRCGAQAPQGNGQPISSNNNTTSNNTVTNTSTSTSTNNDANAGQPSSGTASPVETNPAAPEFKTQEQINSDIVNAAAKIVRAKYPGAIFYATQNMPSGRPGTEMVVSQTDPTGIVEFWNVDGVVVPHWIDTTLGSN